MAKAGLINLASWGIHPSPAIATPSDGASVSTVLLWSAVLIVILVLAAFAVQMLRKWVKASDDEPAEMGFSISAMRQMHRRGELSDEEFAKIKEKLTAATREVADRIKPLNSDSSPGQRGAENRGRRSQGELDAIVALEQHKTKLQKPPPSQPQNPRQSEAPGEPQSEPESGPHDQPEGPQSPAPPGSTP